MGSVYTKVVSKFLFPLHERLKKHTTTSVLNAMEQSEWWSQERLDAYQRDRLAALLRHAQQHVPYYRKLFAELELAPEDIGSVADLQRLPLLTKALIRANAEALKADNAVGLSRGNTGGSSGEPLIFFLGRERVSHDVAAKWRATRWWGVDIGDPEIVVWGSPIEVGAQDRVRALRDRLLRTRLIPAFEMSPANLDRFIEEIRGFRPAMLFGYPSSLALIARRAASQGIAMDDLGIEVAFVTSERLYDEQRQTIASVFGCRVANGYGGRDAGFIAHECPAGSMHITWEDIVVEVVDSEGRQLPHDEPGEIVVTHLATRDYPFIRYRTGDVGVLSATPCSCGRGLPVLAEIQGRTTDFVVAKDGTIMHGLALIYVVRDIEGVEKFKIIQESLDLTRVLLVPGRQFDDSDIETIRGGLAQRLGEGVQVDVEIVADIPAEKSGKFRYIVSKVETG